jgi:hypothetical protein
MMAKASIRARGKYKKERKEGNKREKNRGGKERRWEIQERKKGGKERGKKRKKDK